MMISKKKTKQKIKQIKNDQWKSINLCIHLDWMLESVANSNDVQCSKCSIPPASFHRLMDLINNDIPCNNGIYNECVQWVWAMSFNTKHQHQLAILIYIYIYLTLISTITLGYHNSKLQQINTRHQDDRQHWSAATTFANIIRHHWQPKQCLNTTL